MDVPHEDAILQQLAEQRVQLEALQLSINQLRRYFLLKFIVTIVLVFTPIIIGVITLPKFIEQVREEVLPAITGARAIQQFGP